MTRQEITRRPTVYWIGAARPSLLEDELRARDLEFLDFRAFGSDPTEIQQAAELASGARGLVIQHDPNKFIRTISLLEQFNIPPLRYAGTSACVLVTESSEIPRIVGKFDDLQKRGIRIVQDDQAQYATIAQQFANPWNDPGRAPNFALKIETDIDLQSCQETLLQRSFADCQSITVRAIANQGFSANVLTVYADFEISGATSRSLPFLIKFDKGEDLIREINNYKDYINHFVPFNLRPNLDMSRCFPGMKDETGIIVANYVSRATPLLDAIDRSGGAGAIHCLFEETLARWLHNSNCKNDPPLAKALTNRFDLIRFNKNPGVYAAACNLGAKVTPTTLRQMIDAVPCIKYRHGISHRDLHANNILVRGSEAIVIDYPKCEHGPVLIDLATLDVSIAFHTLTKAVDAKALFPKWTRFVLDIYDKERLTKPPERREAFESYSRQWSCIRQIRQLALSEQFDPLEYAVCIAIELLRCSMYVDDENIGEQIAAYAYYLCYRLTNSLTPKPGEGT